MRLNKPLRIAVAATAGLMLCAAAVADQSSQSYRIRWDVADAGGGVAVSANYVLNDSIAQAGPVGEGFSSTYILAAGFTTPPDADADLVRDFMDNCSAVQNTDQRDSDADGFGNLCDGDFNGDNIINAIDLGILRSRFFTDDPDADLDGNGVVNVTDLGLFKALFFGPPGPSGPQP